MEQIEQRTKEWFDQRCGKFTASEIHKLMTKTKEGDKISQGAKSYVMDKLAERLTGYKETPVTMAMSWGIEYESLAKKAFTSKTGIEIQECGFIERGSNFGGSPDGLIKRVDPIDSSYIDDGIIEIKCPFDTATHLEYCLTEHPEDLPTAYYWQMQANMYLTGSSFCYFISFDPRIDHDCGLFIMPVFRNDDNIKLMIDKVRAANDYLLQLSNKLSISTTIIF